MLHVEDSIDDNSKKPASKQQFVDLSGIETQQHTIREHLQNVEDDHK